MLHFLLLFAPTFAFDKDGHDAIGMIATNGLDAINNRATFELKKLLQRGDASDAGYWTHEVEAKITALGSLHFQGQSGPGVCKADLCPDGKCLGQAIRAFYSQLIGDDIKPYSGLLPPGLSLTDTDALKFLITLVGDLHQPMHVSLVSDDFGRKSPTELAGKKTNMFDVWEFGLTALETPSSSWWSGWTQISNAPTFNADKAAFESKGINVVDDWLDESAKYYCRVITPQLGREIENGQSMQWRMELRSRLLTAGSRLAVLLHGILSERAKRGRTAFRSGSAFDPIPEPDFVEAAVTSHSTAAMVNLGVLASVLLAFVLFVRHINSHSLHLKD
jgi:hypothetical protein